MSVITKPLQELVQELPADVRAEVRDLIELLAGQAESPCQDDVAARLERGVA